MSRDSSVGIATRYGLDGSEIKSRWGAKFSASVQNGPGDDSASYKKGYGVSFPREKWQGRGVNHSPPSKVQIVERVKLYLCTPSWPSWPVLRANFTSTIYCNTKWQRTALKHVLLVTITGKWRVLDVLLGNDVKPRYKAASIFRCDFQKRKSAYIRVHKT